MKFAYHNNLGGERMQLENSWFCMFRTSESNTSTTWYPQCLAATCASVVFPRPGGPQSKMIWNHYKWFVTNDFQHLLPNNNGANNKCEMYINYQTDPEQRGEEGYKMNVSRN